MRAVEIDGGVAVNAVNAPDQAFADAQGWIVSDTAEVGDLWDGSVFTKPAVDQAAVLLERRKAMTAQRGLFAIACRQAGVIDGEQSKTWGPGNGLPANVAIAITGFHTDPNTQLVIDQDALDDDLTEALSAVTIRRLHPIVDIVRVAFSLTETEADDIFDAAIAMEQPT